MLKVHYILNVQGEKFYLTIEVKTIPAQKSSLRAAGYSFIVTEVEQHLDSYIEKFHESDTFCDAVYAISNPEFHNVNDSACIKAALIEEGWIKR